jgi:predicted DNA-binding protein
MSNMLSIRISDDMSYRIENLSKKTNRPKSFYIKMLLENYFSEIEENYLALDILNNKKTKYYTTEEMEKLLDI